MRPPLFLLAAAVVLLSGCTDTQHSADNVRERTADATAVIKNDVKAAAQGIKEGLSRGASDPAHPVNLNTASPDDLQTLPGITHAEAAEIISHRPYASTDELRTRHILSSAGYYRISSLITTAR